MKVTDLDAERTCTMPCDANDTARSRFEPSPHVEALGSWPLQLQLAAGPVWTM
jgi:hypothetical protein